VPYSIRFAISREFCELTTKPAILWTDISIYTWIPFKRPWYQSASLKRPQNVSLPLGCIAKHRSTRLITSHNACLHEKEPWSEIAGSLVTNEKHLPRSRQTSRGRGLYIVKVKASQLAIL